MINNTGWFKNNMQNYHVICQKQKTLENFNLDTCVDML